jgi:hypothetical protein
LRMRAVEEGGSNSLVAPSRSNICRDRSSRMKLVRGLSDSLLIGAIVSVQWFRK